MRDADRRHDVSALTSGELERIKRDLQVSLSLAWPDSPARVPMLAHLGGSPRRARRARAHPTRERLMIRLCSCGFATDDDTWFDCHLIGYRKHRERILFFRACWTSPR